MLLVKDNGARRDTAEGGEPVSHVRVTGVRRGQYVEFDFIMGDPDLLVELVMPMSAFRAFCRDRQCRVGTIDAAARDAFVALGGAPLLSPPSNHKALREIAR